MNVNIALLVCMTEMNYFVSHLTIQNNLFFLTIINIMGSTVFTKTNG